MAEIRLMNVIKRFSKVVAVDRVNLVAKDKEFLVLVGPSGCGKTTTLRMIAGLEEATEGDIYIGERRVNNVHPKDRDIAMVFQNYALYPHMNIFKNMAFGLKQHKVPKQEINRRVQETAELLGIDGLLKRKPKELSGGQRQRVAMGRAIVRKPKAFLFDEPLSNLDAKLRVKMRGELAKLHAKFETTSIYVTHDQIEAMTLADRIVVMDQGKIQQVGEPMEVYDKPKNLFVAGFIGSPTMNFFEGRVVEEGGGLAIKGEDFMFPIPTALQKRYEKVKERDIIFGIRPEHIFVKERWGATPNGEIVRAKVDVVEPIGSEIIILATAGKWNFTACVDPSTRVAKHSEEAFIFDMEQVHLFDKNTEEALELN